MTANENERMIGSVQILLYADDKCAVEAGSSGVTQADDVVQLGEYVAKLIAALPPRIMRRDR